jgi:hypothetical protein
MEWLSCTVTEGQFTGEYAVQGKLFNSDEFSMFVPENYIQVRETPIKGKRVDGLMKVNILDEKGGLVLISLPIPTFENGKTITVKREQLQATT